MKDNVTAFRINAKSGKLSALEPRKPAGSSRFSSAE
jgi:hypothetical protein